MKFKGRRATHADGSGQRLHLAGKQWCREDPRGFWGTGVSNLLIGGGMFLENVHFEKNY
jgi:hypothetical protein